MVKLHIQNPHVRANVAFVIEAIHDRHPLTFALHRKTGLLSLPGALSPDYMLVHLHLEHEVYLTAKDQAQPFDLLEAKAEEVISETCLFLKKALSHVHDVRELGHLELDPSMTPVHEQALLHEAWHAVEREDAERMLLTSAKGTYLFRKDRFAGCLEAILGTAKKKGLKCLTLTYLDPKGQVRDKTIVHWKDRWLFYDDDPTLSGDDYETLEGLLASLGAILKKPLLSRHGLIRRH